MEIAAQRHQLGHHISMAARSFGLALQRPELTADLLQQVLRPQQGALGRLQATLGLFLAAAVLGDTRSLLDHRAPVLRPGRQDRVELGLRDDRVLLAADPGVRKELLDIEQAARRTVYLVLRLAAAPERPRYAYLRKVDREEPGRVVDRERNLGPAEARHAWRCRQR